MKKTISIVILFCSILYIPIGSFAQHRVVMIFSTSTFVEKGKNALENGDIDKAIGYLNKAIRLGLSDIEFYTANNDLCVAHYLNEEFIDAMEYCNIAIKFISNKWVAYNNKGNIYLATGRYTLAIQNYEKGLSLKKSSEVLKANLEIAFNRKAYVDERGIMEQNPRKPEPSIKNKLSSARLAPLR